MGHKNPRAVVEEGGAGMTLRLAAFVILVSTVAQVGCGGSASSSAQSAGPPEVSVSGVTNVPYGPGFFPTVEMGNVPIGLYESQTVTLANVGGSPLDIDGVLWGYCFSTNCGDFHLSDNCPITPSVLAPGASCTFTVTFAPTSDAAGTIYAIVCDNGTVAPGTYVSAEVFSPPPCGSFGSPYYYAFDVTGTGVD
jgi:hypothetical protein